MGRRFADALVRAEETGNAAELVALFAEDAELRSLFRDGALHGIDGARTFWREYLGSFQDLRSRFQHVTETDRLAVLEWITEGTLSSGTEVSYRGVSLVEHDGVRVHSFRTYYDSAALGAHRRAVHSNTSSITAPRS